MTLKKIVLPVLGVSGLCSVAWILYTGGVPADETKVETVVQHSKISTSEMKPGPNMSEPVSMEQVVMPKNRPETVSIGENVAYVPVDELPTAFANADYTALDMNTLEIENLKKDDVISIYVPQLSEDFKFKVSNIDTDDYGSTMTAMSEHGMDFITFVRTDPNHAEGTLEINNETFALIQIKDKLMVVKAKGFFKDPDPAGDDDAVLPPS